MLTLGQKIIALTIVALMSIGCLLLSPILGVIVLFASVPFSIAVLKR